MMGLQYIVRTECISKETTYLFDRNIIVLHYKLLICMHNICIMHTYMRMYCASVYMRMYTK